jgi:pilus assembly protein Flp/PilA
MHKQNIEGRIRMSNFFDFVSTMLRHVRSEDGQTMAEYGILIAVIAIIVIVAATVLGGSISALFNSTAGQV